LFSRFTTPPRRAAMPHYRRCCHFVAAAFSPMLPLPPCCRMLAAMP